MEKSKSTRNNTLRMLTEAAVFIAAAQILSYIKLWQMPYGGSVCLAMLPILFFAVRWGLGPGLLAGFVFGILQFVFDGGFAFGWQSMIGDYLIAFLALGLAGIGHNKKGGIIWGSLLGCCARFVVHFVVGATVWASYMPDEYLGKAMSSPWIYSFLYNILYMLPSTAACIVVLAILMKPLKKYINGEDLRKA